MNLSQKLQNRRKEMKLTQEEVAKKIHVSRQTISNWETGRTLPDITSLVLISDIYDISLDKLIKEDDKVIKKLSSDTKEAENWFAFSNIVSNLLTWFLATQGNTLPLKVTMFLLIIQTIIIGYLGIKGLPFLKKIQEKFHADEKYKNKGYVVGFYDVVYGVTIISGIAMIGLTIITM